MTLGLLIGHLNSCVIFFGPSEYLGPIILGPSEFLKIVVSYLLGVN